MRSALCPGHIKREDQELIAARPGPEQACYCALCGQKVPCVHKDGAWVPQEHTVHKPKSQTVPENYLKKA